MIDQPILITGAARSGTSLVASIIHACGAFAGDINTLNENLAIRQMVKDHLQACGYDPLGQDPIPEQPESVPTIPGLSTKVGIILKDEGYQGGPWAYKGAKMTLMWPQWVEAFPSAKWVLVRRDSEEIAASCMRTNFMKKRDSHDSWLRWAQHHRRQLVRLYEAMEDSVFVWPGDLISGDMTWAFRDLTEWLGLEWNSEALDLIDRTKWHDQYGKSLATKEAEPC